MGLVGVGKIWRPCDLRFRSYKHLYTHTHTHAHKAINIIVYIHIYIFNYLFIYILAGPAVFRGRLRVFGKCTNGVAFSKGRPNLASVRLTL